MQKKKKEPKIRRKVRLTHTLFGESYYENLGALMDEQIAELMRDPEYRRMIKEFNVRMFQLMTKIAKKQMA